MEYKYSKMEMMICAASKILENGRMVAVGTGAPCAAAMLAQKTHAPDLVIAFEAGSLAPILPQMPISVGDSRTLYKAESAASMTEMMELCSRGLVDYAFLGGAQIDRFGNINSTVIGDHDRPKVRFPGSGGANDFASLCWRTIIMTIHSKSRFVENLDFLTSPGYLDGPGGREEAGLPVGTGPHKIITDLAIMGFAEGSKAIQVESLHPGVTLEEVREKTGFEVATLEDMGITIEPSDEELEILRNQVDPHGYILGRN